MALEMPAASAASSIAMPVRAATMMRPSTSSVSRLGRPTLLTLRALRRSDMVRFLIVRA
ncbi:hypothetical protein [Streptomyces sp. NBC_00829]|uniref:hypothetical protein n=1 Tax=Streptomyces sp. NBC_00829 TaxID=2903679 RepID=UPI003865CCCC|nr:hypothetical protein OG293_31540 [Streptomyces sp. NBC_00829]